MSGGTRRYRSELREAQAAETRSRVLRAAAEEFAAHGYTGTPLTAIARTAGVSVETVKLQGAKHELLLAAFEVTFSGRESRDPIANDEASREILANTPPEELPTTISSVVADLNARASGLWLAVTGAATSDPAVRAGVDDLLERRRKDFALIIEAFSRAGLIAPTADRTALAAALSFLASPEGYQQLVVESGLSVEAYRGWLATAIRRMVVDEE